MSKAEELYIEALFNEFKENRKAAGEEVKKVYGEYGIALDNYISAIEADTFKEAYIYLKEHDRVIRNKNVPADTDTAKDIVKSATEIISETYDMKLKTAKELAKDSESKVDAVCIGFQYGYIQGIKAAEATGHING